MASAPRMSLGIFERRIAVRAFLRVHLRTLGWVDSRIFCRVLPRWILGGIEREAVRRVP